MRVAFDHPLTNHEVMMARCSKCEASGREHKQGFCPPKPGDRARARKAFLARGSAPPAETSDIPVRGAPIPGTGSPKEAPAAG